MIAALSGAGTYFLGRVDRRMDESVSQFLQFLAVEKGASNNTIAAYRNDIQQFSTFCVGRRNGNGWGDINRAVILEYMQELQANRYAEATVARKVAAVKSFFGPKPTPEVAPTRLLPGRRSSSAAHRRTSLRSPV